MKTSEFLERYKFPFDEHAYIKQFDDMVEVWNQSYKPLLLISILKHLDNANYDLPLINYVLLVVKKLESLANNEQSKKTMNKGIDIIKLYYDGFLKFEKFVKECDSYGTHARQLMVSDETPKKEKRLIFSVEVGMLWLMQKKVVLAAQNITKHIPSDETMGMYANLLRECVGNPFLT